MAQTGLKVYDGGNITFYSADTTQNAYIMLNTLDQFMLVNNSTAPGLITNGISLMGSPLVSGIWNGTVIGATYGGTGKTGYASGDMLYADSTTTLATLAKGTQGQVLAQGASYPGWSDTIGYTGRATVFAGDVNILGNLTVSGTNIIVHSTAMTVDDTMITVAAGTTGVPANDGGLMIERGTSLNSFIIWKESAGPFTGLLASDMAGVNTATANLLANRWYVSYPGNPAQLDQIVTASGMQALVHSTYNNLTLTSAATGFTILGGTAPKILTVDANLTASTALSLTGTANRISVGAGTTLSIGGSVGTIDIHANYVGQSSITTVGALTTGSINWAGDISTTGKLVVNSSTASAITLGTDAHITAANANINLVTAATFNGATSTNLQMGGTTYLSVTSANVALTNAATLTLPNSNTLTGTTNEVTFSKGIIFTTGSSLSTSTFQSGFTGYGFSTSVGATGGLGSVTIATGGTNYTIGDILAVAGYTGGQLKVTNVSSGAVTAVSIDRTGSGFSVGGPLNTTLISGANIAAAGCTINVATIVNKYITETDDLVVRGTMSVYELLISQVRATNGTVFVSNAVKIHKTIAVTKITGNLGQHNSTYTFTIEPGSYMTVAVDDLIRAQRFTGDAIYQLDFQVTAVTDSTFTATLIVPGAGTNYNTYLQNGGLGVLNGLDFVRLGNATVSTRQGAVYLTADDSKAPYIDITDGVTSHSAWNSQTNVKARLGKLGGITDTTVGLTAGNTNYGLYTNSAYLKGNLVVGGGSAITLSANTIAIGNVVGTTASGIKIALTGTAANDGIFGYDGSGNENFALRLNGTAQIAGWAFTNTGLSVNTNDILLDAANKKISVYNDAVKMYYVDGTHYGITDGSKFSLGSSNKIGGWTFDSSALYALGSGVPTGTPSNGIVINGNGASSYIKIYDGTITRVTLGYISSNVYGIKGTDGIGGTLFELSDTQNIIGGWTISGNSLFNGRSAISSPVAGIYLGTDGIEVGGASATPYVKFNSAGGVIAGWTVTSTSIYNGSLYLDSANTKIIAGNGGSDSTGSTNRVVFGLYDGVNNNYGMRVWDGTNTYVELSSDTSKNRIAGWYFDSQYFWGGGTGFANGTLVILASGISGLGNTKIALGTAANSITVGGTNAGIILKGDGTFQFMKDANNRIVGDANGLYIASSNLVLSGTNITINSPQKFISIGAGTTFNSGSGIWFGWDSTAYKFSVGVANNNLVFDGTNLSISGNITANAGYIGGSTGWTIASQSINSTTAGNTIWMGNGTLSAYNSNGTGTWLKANGEFRFGTIVGGVLISGMIFDSSTLQIVTANMSLTNSGNFWATAGGFGGTAAAPKIGLQGDGIFVSDANSFKRLYIGIPSTGLDSTGWRDYTTTVGYQCFMGGSTDAYTLISGGSDTIYPAQMVVVSAGNWATADGYDAYVTAGYTGGQVIPPNDNNFTYAQGGTPKITDVTPTGSSSGSGYVVGDLISVSQGSGKNAILRVASVTGGAVTALQILAGGTGYSTGTAVPTIPLNNKCIGRGCTVTIGAVANQANPGIAFVLKSSAYAIKQSIYMTANKTYYISWYSYATGYCAYALSIYNEGSTANAPTLSTNANALTRSDRATFWANQGHQAFNPFPTATSSWAFNSRSFTPTADGWYTIVFGADSGYPWAKPEASASGLWLDNISVRSVEYFTDISSKGIYVFNSPTNYIKMGQGVFDIKGANANFSNVTVTNTLTVNGYTTFNSPVVYNQGFISYGPQSNAAAQYILNYDMATNGELDINSGIGYGLEIAQAGLANPALIFKSSGATTKWFLTNSTGGAPGSGAYDCLASQELVTIGFAQTLSSKTLDGSCTIVSGSIISDATALNTANMIVKRNASGDFAAGTITATLTGNATTASKWLTGRRLTLNTDLSGYTTFDGSTDFNLNATIVAGAIDNSKVAAGAGIVYSKLNLSNSIVNADIAAGAAIVDTKLATISTAGKISGSAITSKVLTYTGTAYGPQTNNVAMDLTFTYTTYNVTGPVYSKLLIFVDGILQQRGVDYKETTSSAVEKTDGSTQQYITWQYDLSTSAVITAVYMAA